jgi:hypothetical protein
MEPRARAVIIYMGLVSCIFSLYFKFHLASLCAILFFTCLGCVLFYALNIAIAIMKHPEGSQLLFHKPIPSDTSLSSYMFSLSSHTEIIIIGLIEGFYFGYNISAAYNAYFSYNIIHSIVIITNCLSSIIGFNAILIANSSKDIQPFLQNLFDETSCDRDAKNVVLNCISGCCLGEFMGIGGTLYAVFFEVMYYCVYIMVRDYKFVSIIVALVYISSCTFHYFYIVRAQHLQASDSKEGEIITV